MTVTSEHVADHSTRFQVIIEGVGDGVDGKRRIAGHA